MTAPRSRLAPLLVFLAAAVYFFIGATQRDLWTTGEHRYAEVARVVTAEGRDHLVPHLNGEVYPDKPPLFFWAAGVGHRFLGLGLPLSSKVPSILGGAFTVMLTFLLGRRWYGTAAGIAAAAVLATTDLFDWASRFAHLDAFLTTIITSVMYCFVRADATPREEPGNRNLWTALGFLAVGAGILVKGPPAPLIPGVTILVFLLWTAPRDLLTPKFAWGALLAVLPGAVWAYAAAQDAGWGYIDDLVRGHAFAHAAGDIDKVQPWFYYIWNVPLHLVPWIIFLPGAVYLALARGRTEERRTDRLLVAWLVASWVLFSFSRAKRDLYLLPLHPAAALLVARLFRDVAEHPERLRDAVTKWPRRIFCGSVVVAGCLTVLVAVLVLTGADQAILAASIPADAGRLAEWRDKYDSLRGQFGTGRLVVAAALACVATWGGFTAWRAQTAARIGVGLVAATAAYHLIDATVLWPTRDAEESPRAFLEAVKATIGTAPIVRLGGDGGLQYAVNWILVRDRVPDMQSARRAGEFLSADASSPRYVVTDASQTKKAGDVSGAVEILRAPRRRGPALLLLGNPAAAAKR